MSLALRIAERLGLDAETAAGFAEAFEAAVLELRREVSGLVQFPPDHAAFFSPELLLLSLWAEVRSGVVTQIVAVTYEEEGGRIRTWWTDATAGDVLRAAAILQVEGVNMVTEGEES